MIYICLSISMDLMGLFSTIKSEPSLNFFDGFKNGVHVMNNCIFVIPFNQRCDAIHQSSFWSIAIFLSCCAQQTSIAVFHFMMPFCLQFWFLVFFLHSSFMFLPSGFPFSENRTKTIQKICQIRIALSVCAFLQKSG